jgi:hypothetical protein
VGKCEAGFVLAPGYTLQNFTCGDLGEWLKGQQGDLACAKPVPPALPGTNQLKWFDEHEGWKIVGGAVGIIIGVCCLVCLLLWKSKHKRQHFTSVLRASLLGGSEQMPEVILANRDVDARW